MADHKKDEQLAAVNADLTSATSPASDEAMLDPFEINFLPEYTEGRGLREPFVNEYGVVIGDHNYESSNSPLEQWDKNTDPTVMSGDQWVHPFKDIGFRTRENRELFEQGIAPNPEPFMHAEINTQKQH